MSFDTTSLFLHVLAATAIAGGGLAQVLAGARLRAAASATEVATWSRFVRSLGFVIAGGSVVSLLTGGHLAGAVWTTEARSGFSHPFITLGTVAVLVLLPVGPMVGGAQLRRLAAAADTAPGASLPELVAAARSPRLWGPVTSLLGVAVGMVAVMIYKPGWLTTGIVLLATFALGWALGIMTVRRGAV